MLDIASEVAHVSAPMTLHNDRVAQLLVQRGDRYLVGVLLQESLILAVLGFLPGFISLLGFYSLLSTVALLPIVMTLSQAISVLSLTLVMCISSGMTALRKLQSVDLPISSKLILYLTPLFLVPISITILKWEICV